MSPELKRTLQFAIEVLMKKELRIITEGSQNYTEQVISGIPYCAQEIVQWLDDVYSDMAKATLQEKVQVRNKIIPATGYHHSENT